MEGGGTPIKSRGLPEFPEMKESVEIKVAWVHRTEYWREDNCPEVEPQRPVEPPPPFSTEQPNNQHMHMRELLANKQLDSYIQKYHLQ